MTRMNNVELIKFESNVQLIKYKVLKEVSKQALEGTLKEKYADIPEIIVPGPKPLTRCCIYHEREVVKQRVKLARNIGNSNNIIQVIDAACDECPVQRYKVTEACRGCLAHKCQETCPFNAISIINHKASINPELCKECGKCQEACPYNAIADVRRPCIKACKSSALYINKYKKAVIDDDKCIQCGHCVYACPFGAIMDKSYIVDVIELLKETKKHKSSKVYAIIAPTIASQFNYATIGQVVNAIKKLGFQDVIEVALGADIVALEETNEFKKKVGQKGIMTSSCCPAFVSFIYKNYPELKENISSTVSPMVAVGRLIKKIHENSKVVFIGPCIAKKWERKLDDIKDSIDYVLTFEELLALLGAADIEIKECKEEVLDNASFYGRIFARSGGLTESVKRVIEEENLDVDYKPIICNGIKECDINLKLSKLKRCKGNFIEGMICEGGCIGGPGTLQHQGVKNVRAIDQYGKLAKEKEIKDSTQVFPLKNLNLDRDYKKAFK